MDKVLEDIKKECLMQMKIMDTTMKGIKESSDYKEAQAYNKAIRDVIKIIDKHKMH